MVYGTGQGQTAKVAAHLDAVLSVRGMDVTTRHVAAAGDVDIEAFDGVLVGASVNRGRHQPEVLAFVEDNRGALEARPSGFFQLSLASAIPSLRSREGATEYVRTMVETTGWQPDRVGLFAGALRYSAYGLAMRLAFKLAATALGLESDTARDHEYTDWREVEAFGADFAALVERERATAGPATAASTGPDRPGRTGRRVAALLAAALGVAGALVWARSRRRRAGEGAPPDETAPAAGRSPGSTEPGAVEPGRPGVDDPGHSSDDDRPRTGDDDRAAGDQD